MRFKQNLKEFFTSKTNQTAIIAIVSTSVAWYFHEIPASVAVQTILGSIFAITIKDAIAGK